MKTLHPNTIAFIERTYHAQKSRVLRLQTDQGTVIIKGQRPYRAPFRYWAVRVFGLLIRSSVLRPFPQMGGKISQNIEVKRLAQLKQAGVNVPCCLYASSNLIVLDYLNGEMLELSFNGSPQKASHAFQLGLRAIQEVHSKGQYLGQPFAKNMLVSSGEIFFIDFEEDLRGLDRDTLRARDYALFLLSSVWQREDLWSEWTAAASSFFSQQTQPTVAQKIFEIQKKLRFFSLLPGGRGFLGRDLYALKLTLNFLRELSAAQS